MGTNYYLVRRRFRRGDVPRLVEVARAGIDEIKIIPESKPWERQAAALRLLLHEIDPLLGAFELDVGEGLHIGKANAGWVFALRIYPLIDGEPDLRLAESGVQVDKIEEIGDWIPLFEKYGVVDEYGRAVEPKALLDQITLPFDFAGQALRRRPIDPGRIVGHGPTYDLCVHEFS